MTGNIGDQIRRIVDSGAQVAGASRKRLREEEGDVGLVELANQLAHASFESLQQAGLNEVDLNKLAKKFHLQFYENKDPGVRKAEFQMIKYGMRLSGMEEAEIKLRMRAIYAVVIFMPEEFRLERTFQMVKFIRSLTAQNVELLLSQLKEWNRFNMPEVYKIIILDNLTLMAESAVVKDLKQDIFKALLDIATNPDLKKVKKGIEIIVRLPPEDWKITIPFIKRARWDRTDFTNISIDYDYLARVAIPKTRPEFNELVEECSQALGLGRDLVPFVHDDWMQELIYVLNTIPKPLLRKAFDRAAALIERDNQWELQNFSKANLVLLMAYIPEVDWEKHYLPVIDVEIGLNKLFWNLKLIKKFTNGENEYSDFAKVLTVHLLVNLQAAKKRSKKFNEQDRKIDQTINEILKTIDYKNPGVVNFFSKYLFVKHYYEGSLFYSDRGFLEVDTKSFFLIKNDLDSDILKSLFVERAEILSGGVFVKRLANGIVADVLIRKGKPPNEYKRLVDDILKEFSSYLPVIFPRENLMRYIYRNCLSKIKTIYLNRSNSTDWLSLEEQESYIAFWAFQLTEVVSVRNEVRAQLKGASTEALEQLADHIASAGFDLHYLFSDELPPLTEADLQKLLDLFRAYRGEKQELVKEAENKIAGIL